jgi:hypothetical protein
MELDSVVKMSRDLAQASSTLGRDEARFLVSAYYRVQEYRIMAANQIRALTEAEEPHEVLRWMFDQHATMEAQIKRALDKWTDASEASVWAKGIVGIGPVLAAGLAAHIDIRKAPTPGHIWRFAGFDPTIVWEKGKKRPFNAELKVIGWKIGQSFMKQAGREKDIYGKLYRERKALEIARNDRGELAEQAERKLKNFKIGADTDAHKWYTSGKLPPAHIDERARRWVVKLFLAHYHHVAYEVEFGCKPPRPYVMEFGGHAHEIAPPNWR